MQNSQFTGNDNVDAIEAQGMQAVLQLAARLGGVIDSWQSEAGTRWPIKQQHIVCILWLVLREYANNWYIYYARS